MIVIDRPVTAPPQSLSLACTGFVSVHSGSVASANAVLLRSLLDRGHRVSFFTKPSFVDPRPAVSETASAASRFDLVDCTNSWTDGLRRCVSPSGRGMWGRLWSSVDSGAYNRSLVSAMSSANHCDVDLWLGDWARGRGPRPIVSFVQGPPGTDARSVWTHRELIERLAGKSKWLQLAAYGRWRLSAGLPPFQHSDHVIVGSEWSRQQLIRNHGLASDRTHAIPYPIDLEMFSPPKTRRPMRERLRLFWLGRFAPRKRLDVFLDGLELAIRNGCDAEAWVVGRSGFVPHYERLLEEFPYPDRLRHWDSVPRKNVPSMLADVDVMAQPSDNEDFGSSVAESLACGVPVIAGATNGTADYVCGRSIRLANDKPESMSAAIESMSAAKLHGELADRGPSRSSAESWFHRDTVVSRLEEVLRMAASGS